VCILVTAGLLAHGGPAAAVHVGLVVETRAYRWANPLPAGVDGAAFAAMGAAPGARLTAADLRGVHASGGPGAAIECGLIEPIVV
jgi:hypothetical protein